jgi:hypothetical protein
MRLGGYSGRNCPFCESSDALSRPRLNHGHTGRPGLFHSHQGGGPAEQGQVLGELDQVILSLIWILSPPEIVHEGETPARKPIIAAAPSFGLIPNRVPVPPTIINPPVTATAASGLGRPFASLLGQRLALDEMMDSAVKKEAAE